MEHAKRSGVWWRKELVLGMQAGSGRVFIAFCLFVGGAQLLDAKVEQVLASLRLGGRCAGAGGTGPDRSAQAAGARDRRRRPPQLPPCQPHGRGESRVPGEFFVLTHVSQATRPLYRLSTHRSFPTLPTRFGVGMAAGRTRCGIPSETTGSKLHGHGHSN